MLAAIAAAALGVQEAFGALRKTRLTAAVLRSRKSCNSGFIAFRMLAEFVRYT